MRKAVFFHFFEHTNKYRENLIYFLSTAYREELDFYIIISGTHSVSLPNIPNINYINTENKNNDYGGYSYALSEIKDKINKYSHFIFINSSVRGPFLTPQNTECWTNLFCNQMNDEIHLAGSSINILPKESRHHTLFKNHFEYKEPYSHIQTTAYALSAQAINHLLDIGFYDIKERLTKDEVICKYEIRLSQEIKRAGWNIKPLLSKYNNTDYRKPHTDINHSSRNGDPLFKGAYFGSTAKPNELVFVKTNRNLIPMTTLYFYTYKNLSLIKNKKIKSWEEYKALKRLSLLKLAIAPLLDVQSLISRTFKKTKKKPSA